MKTTNLQSRAEQDIELTNRLYDCRRGARGILGESYGETVQPFRDLIARVMQVKNLPPLRAVLDIGRHVDGDGLQLMLLFAAGVDVIESRQPTGVAVVEGSCAK